MIGTMLRELLESNNEKFRIAKSRMEDRESVATELDEAELPPILHLNSLFPDSTHSCPPSSWQDWSAFCRLV